jgi:hypothetical protein
MEQVEESNSMNHSSAISVDIGSLFDRSHRVFTIPGCTCRRLRSFPDEKPELVGRREDRSVIQIPAGGIGRYVLS